MRPVWMIATVLIPNQTGNVLRTPKVALEAAKVTLAGPGVMVSGKIAITQGINSSSKAIILSS
jgi:hypothetical protein